ncbi:MAG: hypothetical protein GEU26_09445 [Nitrososphaeraceae archaeon]|nr:hypothetical protein [Nitrososphaeraceae archaeon]
MATTTNSSKGVAANKGFESSLPEQIDGIYRFCAYGREEKYGFVNVDPVIVQKLRLTANDYFKQELAGDGETILFRRYRRDQQQL